MSHSKQLFKLPQHLVATSVSYALNEDLGLSGDITTLATVEDSAHACAMIVARQDGVVSGMDLAHEAFKVLDAHCIFTRNSNDGDSVKSGMALARIEGKARALLSGERVALNFMSHLSGIATLTKAYVEKVKGTKAKITDTRKTTPGLRPFEKYAVRCGGGHNHRSGLFDAMMIKDNHILAAGGLSQAIRRARSSAGHMVRIEVEVDTLSQLDEVLRHANLVDAVLLDNMDLKTLARAVETVSGQIICEASGGVSLDSVQQIAHTGVDIISIGALTHSANALDLGLDFIHKDI